MCGILVHQQVIRITKSAFFRRIRKIAKSDNYLRHVCLSVRPSVRKLHIEAHWMEFHKKSNP